MEDLLEKQIGKIVKRLTINNGLELCGFDFSDFLEKVGIVQHQIVVKTPQKNGIA